MRNNIPLLILMISFNSPLLFAENVIDHAIICKSGKNKIKTNIMTSDDGRKIFVYQVIYETKDIRDMNVPESVQWRFDFDKPENPIILRLPDVVPETEKSKDEK